MKSIQVILDCILAIGVLISLWMFVTVLFLLEKV